jgi:hypothetical protein
MTEVTIIDPNVQGGQEIGRVPSASAGARLFPTGVDMRTATRGMMFMLSSVLGLVACDGGGTGPGRNPSKEGNFVVFA